MAGRTTEQKYKEQKQPNLNIYIYIHAFPVTFAQETSTSRRVPLLRKESVDLHITMISLIIQLFAKIISRLFGIYVGEAEVCRPHLNRRCADAMPLRTIGVLYIYIYTYPDGLFVPLSKHEIDTLKRSSFIRDTIRKPCMYLRES